MMKPKGSINITRKPVATPGTSPSGKGGGETKIVVRNIKSITKDTATSVVENFFINEMAENSLSGK